MIWRKLPREDRSCLEAYFQEACKGLSSETRSVWMKAPKDFRNEMRLACERDVRPGVAKTIHAERERQKVRRPGDLHGPQGKALAAQAKAALLPEAAFSAFVASIQPDQARDLRDWRHTWITTVSAVEEFKARVDRYKALQRAYWKDCALDIGPDGLLGFVRSLTPDGWHHFVSAIEWHLGDQVGDLFDAVEWIVEQDTCDRWTAVSFSLIAMNDAIDSETYQFLDTDRTRATMQKVSDKLALGTYRTAELALQNEAKEVADRLRATDDMQSNPGFPIPWDNLGAPGTRVALADFRLSDNRPVKSFDRWLHDTGQVPPDR